MEAHFDRRVELEAAFQIVGLDLCCPLFPRDRFQNLKLIREMDTPLLVIHGENDEVIPVSHGQKLVDASRASDKSFIPISGSGHNDLFDVAGDEIIQHVADFARRVAH